MHEHMGEQLPPPEVGRLPVVQCQVHIGLVSQHILQQEEQNINDYYVLYYSGYLGEAALSGTEHYANVKTITSINISTCNFRGVHFRQRVYLTKL
jgi:hypothetical protein